MKINKINVIYKRSIQMRQFEPAEMSANIEVQVDPSDDIDEVFMKAKGIVRTEVENELARLKKVRKASFDDELEKAV